MPPLRLVLVLSLALGPSVFATQGEKKSADASPGATAAPPSSPDEGEELEVDKIKDRYWGQGEATKVGVVQSRQYAKRRKIELSAIGGIDIGDPFLTTYFYGLTAGYHFTELFSAHAVFFKAAVSKSKSLNALEATGTSIATNPPNYFLGAEGRASLLYGKLSFLGSSIVHFDTYFSLVTGIMKTDSGSSFTIGAGIGEQFHLSRLFSLNLSGKILHYNETLIQRQAGGSVPVGTVLGDRSNWSIFVTFGVAILLDPTGDEKAGEKPAPKPAT